LQDNVKQLQGDVDKFQDSEAMKRAREVYERARVRKFTLRPIQCLPSLNIVVDFEYKRKPTLEGCSGGT
jgi:hypothetical protein